MASKETVIREARPDDIPVIVKMIHELAVYERAPEQCHATDAGLHRELFGPEPHVKGLVAEVDGALVGYALYFHNFSTWECAPGLYLEDVYVRPTARRKGLGKLFLQRLARIADENGCKRFEWQVLDWNTSARDFYHSLGAQAMVEWVPYRLEEDGIRKLAEGTVSSPEKPRTTGQPYSDDDTEKGTLRQPLDQRKTVTVHTDGGADPNPGTGAWAAVLRFDNKTRELFGGEHDTTNNRMEMTAAIRALEALKDPCVIHIHTDSQYLRNGITEWIKNWKRNNWRRGKDPVKNVDLWQSLDTLCEFHEVEWHWVKGHAGNVDNERADQICTETIAKLKAGVQL